MARHCFVCFKGLRSSLATDPDNPPPNHPTDDAGEAVVSFGYGSRYDQVGAPVNPDAVNNGSRADTITRYRVHFWVCDDCFAERCWAAEGREPLLDPPPERVAVPPTPRPEGGS